MQCPFCSEEHPDDTDRCPDTWEVIPRLPQPKPLPAARPVTYAHLALRVDDDLVVRVPLSETVVLGRDRPSPIAPLAGNNISRAHARLTARDPFDIVLEDNDSTNGTYVNNIRVAPGDIRQLADGDTVELANDPALAMTVVVWRPSEDGDQGRG